MLCLGLSLETAETRQREGHEDSAKGKKDQVAGGFICEKGDEVGFGIGWEMGRKPAHWRRTGKGSRQQGGLGQHQASQLLRYDRPHLYRLEYISRFYVPFLLFVTSQGSDVRFLKVLLFLPSHQDKNAHVPVAVCPLLTAPISQQEPTGASTSLLEHPSLLPLLF